MISEKFLERVKVKVKKEKVEKKVKSENKSLLDYYGFTSAEQKKYPVVTGILKQLTPERIKKEITEIKTIELPPELQKWVDEYDKVEGERDKYLWKYFIYCIKKNNYIHIDNKYNKILLEAQFLVTMLVVILDDIVDVKRNDKLFKDSINIILFKKNKEFKKYNKNLIFIKKIESEIFYLIKKFPNFKEFKDIFLHDIKQVLSALELDSIINKNNYLISKAEYWLQSFHTMNFVFVDDLYLMCISHYNKNELSYYKEIFWNAKKMVRIGNWLSTWENEIKTGDFSSGVFAYAVSNQIVYSKEMDNVNFSKVIKKIKNSKIEYSLLCEWEKYYRRIECYKGKIKIINVQELLKQLKILLIVELMRKNFD